MVKDKNYGRESTRDDNGCPEARKITRLRPQRRTSKLYVPARYSTYPSFESPVGDYAITRRAFSKENFLQRRLGKYAATEADS